MTRKLPCGAEAWCPLCYENKRRRSNHRGHYGYRRPKRPYIPKPWEASMKKPGSESNGPAVTGTPGRGDLLRDVQALWCHLVDDLWDDGSSRQRSTLMLTMDGGLCKLWLHDRAAARSAWIAGESLEAAVEALEIALESGSLPWRPDREANGGKQRKSS